MEKQVINKIILPDIIKNSSQFDSKNFNVLLKNMAMRVSLEASLVAIFEIANFKHIEKISSNWDLDDFSEVVLHPKINQR